MISLGKRDLQHGKLLLTTVDLNALHCGSPRLVSKNEQSGRSKRQTPSSDGDFGNCLW